MFPWKDRVENRPARLQIGIGELSSKVLEMPTQNAYANNYRLFQVELVKVIRVLVVLIAKISKGGSPLNL